MGSKERVIRTLEFKNPDRIPIHLWLHPATITRYGEKLEKLLNEYPQDIILITGPTDIDFYPENFSIGEHKDVWGSTWKVIQEGMLGEVKIPAIKEITEISRYRVPLDILKKEWLENECGIDKKIKKGRGKNQFIIGGVVNIFEKMQSLRGTENLFLDLALYKEEVKKLHEKIVNYYIEYLKNYWLTKDIDAVAFSDDWGSQKSLLISPDLWKEIFKPGYEKLFKSVKEANKYIFFHSCGNILELYDEFIELGLDAINSQVWCMGVDNVAKKCSGKITLWGEIDRQRTLPNGKPEDIYKASSIMKERFFINGGGLIGQSLAGVDVPLENIEAILKCWNFKK